MQIDEKIKAVLKDFSTSDWELKYEKIIEYGKNFKAMSDADKNEDLKIKGCQSQVWLKASLNENKQIVFEGDSDALIVKGLLAIVLKIYSNESPEVIIKTEPTFLKEMGFDSGLSPSRTNGLYSMIKQIKYYATAFQYLLSK